jgi:hypothetical protein
VFVKICGVTSEEDGLLAVGMGADAIGLNFVPGSKRQIAVDRARDIVRRLPPETMTVGIFRNELPERVVEIVQRAGLRAAQLHGDESAEDARRVRSRIPVVIKAFADEKCVIAGLGKRCDIAAVPHAGLCDAHHACRHLRGHADRSLLVDFEGHQVALVHTDEIAPDHEGSFQLVLVVNLDQGIETHLLGERMEVAQLCIVEGGSDQQDTVGAHEPGIDHIAGVDREVLSDDRQRDRCTGRLEILHRPTKPVDIGENRQTRCSTRVIGAGECIGVEVGEEIALARRASLDFADHGDRIRSGQCSAETPRRRQGCTLLDERVDRSGVRSR